MGVDVILVHIGDNYPDYINDCIDQLVKYDIKVHLILNSSQINKPLRKDILLAKVEDYVNDQFSNFKIKGYDSSFRDGFWIYTSSRFFILNEYVKRNNIKDFFHIEYDNLIFSDLLDIRDNLLTIKDKNMFVVVDSESRVIPSFIFIKDSRILSEFCNYLMNNQNNNDMTNLFNYYLLNKEVDNLPIIPLDYKNELCSSLGIRPSGKINYSNHYELLNCIFDGAAIGQYIGGVDPRNQSGDTTGFVNETTIFNVSKNKYIFENGEIYMISSDDKIKVINLHIHSKKLKLYI